MNKPIEFGKESVKEWLQEWNKRTFCDPFFSSNTLRTSASAASTAMECLLKYHMIYKEGMRVDKNVLGINLGKAGHRALEFYHHSLLDKDSSVSIQDVLAHFSVDWELAKAAKLQTYQASKNTHVSNQEVAHSLIGKYIDMHDAFVAESETYQPLMYQYPDMKEPMPVIEMPFRIPMVNLNTGSVIVDDCDLIGVIDVGEIYDGNVYILDHKFLAMKPKEFFVENDMQLAIYAYAFAYLAQKGVFTNIGDAKFVHKVGFNWMLKPYRGWGGRKEPAIERKCKSISLDETHGVLSILDNVVFNCEHGRPIPDYEEHCGWKCDLHAPCRAHRLGKNRLEAFKEEFGYTPTQYANASAGMSDDLF